MILNQKILQIKRAPPRRKIQFLAEIKFQKMNQVKKVVEQIQINQKMTQKMIFQKVVKVMIYLNQVYIQFIKKVMLHPKKIQKFQKKTKKVKKIKIQI